MTPNLGDFRDFSHYFEIFPIHGVEIGGPKRGCGGVGARPRGIPYGNRHGNRRGNRQFPSFIKV
jgi:hypothetical protein